jgi:antitoxin component of MazEF toxin-antitoxin module
MLQKDTELGIAVTDLGNSKAVVVPAEWRERLDVEGTADAELDIEQRTVTYHF